MSGLVSSEWLKIRSVRSTAVIVAVLAAAVLLAVLAAWSGTRLWDSLPPARRHTIQGTPLDLVLPLAWLSLAVLGVLAVTSEYATGTIRPTLAAVPRRSLVLAAKAVTVAPIGLIAGEVVLFAAFFASRQIVGDRPMQGYTAPLDGQVRTLLASGLAAMAVALVGLGLGTLLRSTAGAIGAVVALVLVIPTAANLVPPPWGARIAAVMLSNLGPQLAGTASHPVLTQWQALAVMVAYVAAALAAGAIALIGRDA
jgi:hypothetical protein